MTYQYSPSLNLFFVESAVPGYETAGWNLDDLVDVTDQQFEEFNIDRTLEGLIRVAGPDGIPAWGKVPPPTNQELIADAEAEKLQLRAIADNEIAWRQDAVDAEIATEEETVSLAEWKKYRVLLMRVDTTDPKWPKPPATQAS